MSRNVTKITEPTVDKWLQKAVADGGGLTFKMHPMTSSGIPDRIVHRNGWTFYVETKTTGERCTPIQVEAHKRLKQAGLEVYVLDVKIEDYFELFEKAYTTYEGKHYHKNPFKNEK